MEFPVLELEGSPYERGYEHGSKYKKLINDTIYLHFKLIDRYEEHPERKEDKEWLTERMIRINNRNLPYAKEYAPDLVEELRGIADGAGLSFEEIFCYDSAMTITDTIYPTLKHCFDCTTFALSPRVTANGEVFVAQTFDYRADLLDRMIILKIKLKSGLKILVWGTVGTLGYIGMNSEGISLVINNLRQSDVRAGVPMSFIIRKALEQKDIGMALEAIVNARRAKGFNYVVGDKNGEIFNVETTATDYEITSGARDGYVAHTNHYVSERLRPYERMFTVNSLVRLSRINNLIRSKLCKITFDDVKEFLRDHAISYNPISVSRELSRKIFEEFPERIPETMGRRSMPLNQTLTGVIFRPMIPSAWFTYGAPHESDFIEYRL